MSIALEKYTSALPGNLQNKLLRLVDAFVPIAVVLGALSGVLVVILDQPIYILLGLVGLIIFLITLYSTQFGLLIMVFISYTRFSDIFTEFHNSPSIAKPFLVLLVVSILMRWALFREAPQGWVRPAILFGLVLLAEFASVIYSPVPDRVLTRFSDDVKDTIIAVVIVILMQSPSAFRRTIWVLIVSGIFLCSLSVFQYVTGTHDNIYWGFAQSMSHQIVGTVDDFRATGPLGDPNFFAQIVVVFVPISLERFMHERRTINRLAALWCLVVSVLTVIITYSRGGLFAMLAGVIIFFLYYPPQRVQVVFIILAIVAVSVFLPKNYLDRLFTLTKLFNNTGTSRVEERSLQGRLSENLTAFEMIKANPIFGVGLNSYKYLFPTYSKKLGLALVATEREAHNLYLEILAETGMLGFSIFALIMGSCIQFMRKARTLFARHQFHDYAGMTVGYLGGFVAYFFAAIFIHNAFPRYFYLLLGIAFAINLVAQNAVTSKDVKR
jgi:putative inorganic carbon (hco3(-)) transporter